MTNSSPRIPRLVSLVSSLTDLRFWDFDGRELSKELFHFPCFVRLGGRYHSVLLCIVPSLCRLPRPVVSTSISTDSDCCAFAPHIFVKLRRTAYHFQKLQQEYVYLDAYRIQLSYLSLLQCFLPPSYWPSRWGQCGFQARCSGTCTP